MSKEIEFTINKNGEVEIDMIGYHGQGCAEDSQRFVKALGKAKESQKKSEYWEADTKVKQKIKNTGM